MEIFTTIASHFPDTDQSKEALYLLADIYEKWGNIDVAINKYRSLLGLDLNKELADKVKFKIARLQLSRYNTQEGFNSLMVLLSENVDNMLRSDIYTEIARFYSRQKDYQKSQANYDIAISENPKNKDADIELAGVMLDQKKYKDALRQFEHFYNLYINRSGNIAQTTQMFQDKILSSAVKIYHEGNMDSAREYFLFISEKFPSTSYSETSLYYLGNMDYVQGNYSGAMEFFNTIIKSAPAEKDENAYLKKGQCYYQMHEYAKAAMYFNKVQEIFPDGKYTSLAKKWEKESKLALREKFELETIRENNMSDKINSSSSETDIEDFFGKDLPEEIDQVSP
jgi:TolA-binding protein